MAAPLLPVAGMAGKGIQAAALFALFKDLIGPTAGAIQGAVNSPNQALQAGNTQAGKYTISPSQEIAGYQSALLSNAINSLLSSVGLGDENSRINPGELIENRFQKNLGALRETRTGEIALGELGVMSNTNPSIAQGAATVVKSGDDLLGQVIGDILSNARVQGNAAVGQVI